MKLESTKECVTLKACMHGMRYWFKSLNRLMYACMMWFLFGVRTAMRIIWNLNSDGGVLFREWTLLEAAPPMDKKSSGLSHTQYVEWRLVLKCDCNVKVQIGVTVTFSMDCMVAFFSVMAFERLWWSFETWIVTVACCSGSEPSWKPRHPWTKRVVDWATSSTSSEINCLRESSLQMIIVAVP
jgi:hypothetical protein